MLHKKSDFKDSFESAWNTCFSNNAEVPKLDIIFHFAYVFNFEEI